MQIYLFVAAILMFVVGAIHSVVGEKLIFSRMRKNGIVPTAGAPVLRERHVRILWASWHIATVLGWTVGAILLRISFPATDSVLEVFVVSAIIVSTLVSSCLVLFGTKGMHPGWVGFLAVAVLAWL